MMKRFLTGAVVFVLMLAGISHAAVITSVTSRNGDVGKSPVLGGILTDPALAWSDRTQHRIEGIPEVLVNKAEYVKTVMDDKDNATLEYDIVLASNADVYLFIDNRIGDDNAGNPPNLTAAAMTWVTTMGFTDTGLQIGIDENFATDDDIDNWFRVYKGSFSAGTVTLKQQNDTTSGGPGYRAMYGVAAVIPAPPRVPRMDLDELSVLSQDWLAVDYELAGDFYRDGKVDIKDLFFVADNWLELQYTGTGLTGRYYNDTLDAAPEHHAGDFETLMLTRIDPEIDFNWGTGSPDPSVNSDYFSIRWTGQIEAKYTGTYTFYVSSFGGATLRIDNRLLLEFWHPNWSVKTRTGTFDMVAGRKYAIDLTYYTINTNASCKLEWACGTQQPRQVVPQECLYPEYAAAILSYPQIGWAPGVRKVIALATASEIELPQYRVYSSAGQEVLSGTMSGHGYRWGTYQYTADISELTTEDTYSIFVDDYAWATVPVSQTAYTDLYSNHTNGHVGIAEMVDSFWAFQRSNPAVYPDVDLTLKERVWIPDPADPTKQIASTIDIGVTGDVSGGWHDASSKDKSNIETSFSISNMCYALDRMTDVADRTALLNEMRWGTDYLLRIENSPAGWFAYMPDNPRAPWVNKSAGTIGEIARALAAASVIYRDTDPTYADQCLAAAERAWTWIEANPNEFQRGLISTGWCGYAGNVLGAAVELARATGTQKYIDYATTQIQNGQYTDQGGWISKTSTKFPGQSDGWFGMDNDAYTGKSVIALCRYYPIADASTKTTIEGLCRQYVNVVKNRTNNPYRAWDKVFYSWFGFDQNLLSVSHCLLHVGMLFNDTEAMDIGMRNFEWSMGFNPMGGTAAPGLGGELLVPMFSRSVDQSIGGIQPGMLYNSNNELTTWYGISWNIWVIGETGLGSSPVLDILSMLNQYAADTTTAPATPADLTGSAWDQSLELEWTGSFGATSYTVKRSTISGSGYEPVATVSALSFTDTEVAGGVTYYYVVAANNPFGQSGPSNEAALKLISNVALGKSATASSVRGDNIPARALDGNTTTTRWESQFSDPQWFQVDLGATYTLNRLRIVWEHAAAKEYNIQVSATGTPGSWTTVHSATNGPGGTEILTIAPVLARYVKMNGITRKTIYGYSMWEFEVFGY